MSRVIARSKYTITYAPLDSEGLAKCREVAKKNTSALRDAIMADFGITEGDAALVVSMMEFEALYGREALDRAVDAVKAAGNRERERT